MNLSINPCSLAFTANVPETIGLQKANECAKKMLETGSPEEKELAEDYNKSLEGIRQFPDIDEVCVKKNCSDNKLSDYFPYTILVDNIRRQSYLAPIPENYTSLSEENLEDRQALGVINQIIYINQHKDKFAKMK